jgi:hypothetical protein
MKTSRYAFWDRIGRRRATVGRSTAVLGRAGGGGGRSGRRDGGPQSERPRWKCMVGQEEERWWEKTGVRRREGWGAV